MSGYLISVMAATLTVALGGLVSYGGATSRASRAAMGVVLLYTVTVPIISVTGSLSELINTDYFENIRVEYDEDGTVFYEHTAAAFSEGVQRLVCDEYGLDAADVFVRVLSLDVETMRAERVMIILSGRAVIADARAIAYTVESAELGECEVTVDLGR